MKKVILLVLCSSTLFAQKDKVALVGKWLPATVIWTGGKSADVLMRYQPPSFFKNPNNTFYISEEWSPSEVNSTQDPAHWRRTMGTIEAFTIDNTIWALRPSPGSSKEFVNLNQQGAIENYQYITVEYKTEQEFAKFDGLTTTGSVNWKLGGQSYNALQMSGKGDKVYREWVSDSPEIVKELRQADSLVAVRKQQAAANKEKDQKKKDSLAQANKGKEVKKKGFLGGLADLGNQVKGAEDKLEANYLDTEVDMDLLLHNYNAWYERQNPGKIKYYFINPPQRNKSQLEAYNERQGQRAKDASVSDAKEKAKTDLVASRPAVVGVELASAKDDTPVKKETFAAKMDRVKADGNKVGVLFYLTPVKGYKQDPGTGMSSMMKSEMKTSDVFVEGEYSDPSLQSLGKDFTAELNAALGRTDIELIDLSKVPFRTVKAFGITTQVDDFWATKYKVVFAYTVDPNIRASHEGSSGKVKFQATLNFTNSLILREYTGAPTSNKQDIITSMTDLGAFSSPSLTQDEDVKDIRALYDMLVGKLGTPLLEKIKTERADDVKRLVEKKLAP